MKRTGGVLGVGAILASSGAASATAAQEELPPVRGPFADEDWVEYRAGPGKATAISATPDLDPDALEHAVIHDGEYVSSEGAIVGDTLYITGGGRVRALDAHDGTVRWSSDDLGVGGTPAAAYDRLIVSGSEERSLVALDIEDGSVDWSTALEGRTRTPTVAYETVFTISGDTLYALDVTDGSVKWERRPETEGSEYVSFAAVGAGRVYTKVSHEEAENEFVGFDVVTGERRWSDRWNYDSGPAVAGQYVGGADGLGTERFRVLDTESDETVAGGGAITAPSLDDESAMSVLDWEVAASFYDGRDGWQLSNFSTGAPSVPTIAGETVFVYVGGDHREEYRYSLLAIDKYDGEILWTVDVPASQQGIDRSVVATGDAVYVFDQEAIHVVREADAGDGDGSDGDGSDGDGSDGDGSDGDGSDGDGSGGDGSDGDGSDGDDPSTPEDTATPTDTPDDCGCPNESGSTDTPGGGGGTPTNSPTPTDADTASGASTATADEHHQAVENGTSTEETDGAGPGLGVVSALGSLGGLGYVLHRRLGGGEADEEPEQ